MNPLWIPACFFFFRCSTSPNITDVNFKAASLGMSDVISVAVYRSKRPDCYLLLLSMQAGFSVVITFRFCIPLFSVDKNPQKYVRLQQE